MKDVSVIAYLILIVLCVIATTSSILFFTHDNIFEESVEEMVKNETGLDLDLTPSSPED